MKKEDKERIQTTLRMLNERQRRIFLALEAERIGRGGIVAVSKASGASRNTILSGKNDLEKLRKDGSFAKEIKKGETIRSSGAGRKKVEEVDLGLEKSFLELLDHDGPLFYSVQGARSIAAKLTSKGHPVSHPKVVSMLRSYGFDLDYSRSGPLSKDSLKEKDAEFKAINRLAKEYLSKSQPVLFLLLKKQDAPGNKEKKEALDLDAFLMDSILAWWDAYGKSHFLDATGLLISFGSLPNKQKASLEMMKPLLESRLGLAVSFVFFPSGSYAWRNSEKQYTSSLDLKNGPSWIVTLSQIH